jgi:cobalt-zinc-cadmium efflux system protein
MSSPRFETFLARLYSDEAFLERFLTTPAAAIAEANFDDRERIAATNIDRVGLAMAARSYRAKRHRSRKTAIPRSFGSGGHQWHSLSMSAGPFHRHHPGHGGPDSHGHGSHSHGPDSHGHGSHSHGHGAGAHSHTHGHDAGARRLTIALAILGTFTVVEGIGGYLANSVALLAEAAHMLTDSASLVLAILAIRVGRRPADVRRTYGHRRYQPLAAFVNGQVLLLLTGWVIYESISRLMHRPEVDGRLMLIVALLGGVANIAAFIALSGAKSLNERSARAHVLSDLLGSAAATVAAILILTQGWKIADPLLSLFVSALILRSAWALTRESADVLLEGVPAGFDVASVETELVGHIPGLTSVHHVHVWTMTGEHPTITLHAHIEPGTSHHETISAIHLRLAQRLRVEHTTVQIEEGPCASPPCGPDC